MSAFENVVRPFQLPNSVPPQRYVEAKQQSQPPVMLYFGRSGSGRTFNGSYSSQWSRYQMQVVAEDKRPIGSLGSLGVSQQYNQPFPNIF